ncbi:MAG TPA: helix-turn-helix transcriptional regulator [Caulobacteraceae bacterium]
MNEQQHSQLLDLIYGAAVDPGLWVGVMENMADLMGGNTAWLSQVSMADGNGSGIIARIDPVMPQRYTDYYAALNPFAVKARPHQVVAVWKPKISTDRDDFPDDGPLKRTEFFNDFMRPQDIRSVLMIDVAAKGLEVATVNIHRNGRSEPFAEAQLRIAEALHPHLVRAFRLSGAFADLKSLADDTAAALDRAGQGMFILDTGGRLKHVNLLGERMLAQKNGLTVVGGRLSAARVEAAQTLRGLVAAAARLDAGGRRGGSMAIQRTAEGASLSITVSPLTAGSFSVFSADPSVLVCVTDLYGELTLAGDRLREAFRLTAAQARVAGLLLDGAKPKAMAEALGLSVHTVRTHLASVYEKTETAGQADLSRLLMRLTGSGPQ